MVFETLCHHRRSCWALCLDVVRMGDFLIASSLYDIIFSEQNRLQRIIRTPSNEPAKLYMFSFRLRSLTD